jgi:DNA polymerase-3 subunit gamma/tau
LDNWNDILEDLKNSGRMVIYTNLLDAKAVEIDSKVVGIALQEGSGFCKMILSKPENQEIIAELSVKAGKRNKG